MAYTPVFVNHRPIAGLPTGGRGNNPAHSALRAAANKRRDLFSGSGKSDLGRLGIKEGYSFTGGEGKVLVDSIQYPGSGYDNGGYTFEQFMKDKGKVDQFMGEQEMRKLYEKMMREKKVREQKTMVAEGGRIGYAIGTDEKVEMAAGIEGLPVRQNKAGVKELDLRETGGFIQPVGIKEKADDIPAMLSNNEFVFTADAVRAAGGGDIDKGAQLMYDTMKKLESKVV